MRTFDTNDFTTKYTALQSIGEEYGIVDIKSYLNNTVKVLSSELPHDLPKKAYQSIFYSFINIMLNPSLIENEIDIILSDIREALKENNIEYTTNQLKQIKKHLTNTMKNSAKAVTKKSNTESVRTPDTQKTDKKSTGKLPMTIANKTSNAISKDDCIHLFSVYYINTKDNYIYIIGNKGVEKRWPVPVINKRYKEVDRGMMYYNYVLNNKEYIFSREQLTTGKYRLKLPIPLLDTPSFSGAYANCITKIADDTPIYPMLERTGIHEYFDIKDNTTKYGFMLPSGDMLTAKGDYYPYISLRKQINDETKMSEDTLKKYYKYVEKVNSISNKDIQELYTFLKEVSKNGISLILQCHDARSFFTSLRTDEYKASHALLLYGMHHSGKTEMSMFNRGLAYPYQYKGEKDASFRNTLTSIELKLDAIQDLPALLDDLCKMKSDNDSTMRGKEKTIDSSARSLHDNSPFRERANKNLDMDRSNKVRTLLTYTSEYYPDTLQDSTYRRLLAIGIDENEINIKMIEEKAAKLSHAQFAVGYKIILQIINDIEDKGKDATTLMYKKEYDNLKKIVEKKINEKWSNNQNCAIPHYIGSLIEISSDILVGAWMLDRVCKITSFVKDTTDYVVDVLYKHVIKMEDLDTNEEGETVVEFALMQLLEGITTGRSYKIGNSSERLRIADYKNTAIHAQTLFTAKECGYHNSNANEYKVAIYVYEAKEKAYITPEGIEAMVGILNDTGKYRDINSQKALSKLMNDDKWLIELGEGRYLAKKTKEGLPRCLVVSLDKIKELRDNLISKEETEDNTQPKEDTKEKIVSEENLQKKRQNKHKTAKKIQEIDDML